MDALGHGDRVRVSVDTLERAIRKQKKETAMGGDLISARLVTEWPPLAREEIRLLAEECLSSGESPQEFLCEVVVPVPKVSVTDGERKNLRPVAKTSVLGKIVERCGRELYLCGLRDGGVERHPAT